jgi:hypothetical protein
MSFMDIMNIMKVSSSKFTFSLIAFAALLVSGSAFVAQDAYGVFDAPEFTCVHINTTATHCTFDQDVNGTLAMADWGVRGIITDPLSGGSFTCNEGCTDGDITYDYAISAISNATSAGIGATTASAGDIKVSSQGGNVAAVVTGSGFLNGTNFVLIHATIPTGAEYYINYTNNPSSTNNQTAINGQGSGAFHSSGSVSGGVGVAASGGEGASTNKMLKIGSNATAKDWMPPTAVSAEIVKSNAKQIRVLMSEPIYHINATTAHFNFTSVEGNQPIIDSITAGNGTDYLYIHLKSAANISDVITLQYITANVAHNTAMTYGSGWISDAVDTTRYVNSGAVDTAEWTASGHGNKLGNFTLSVTNWLEIGMYGNANCYDCSAPTVAKVQVSLDGSTPVTVTNDNAVQINAGNGDTVSVMVTVADNVGADRMTFAGLYTNFGSTPDNLYYANNFDSFKQMSTSYYEWNARADDTAFGNTDAITWDAATATVNPDRTQTITYTMTINDSIESTQVWIDLGDMANNYAKSALPITLEVAGPPALTFASDDSQQVVSYFNESILLAIVSQWTATSSDDATNVEQLSSVLGIEDQLPTWTTSLASWVSDDKIDVADMIVAVEYVINQ